MTCVRGTQAISPFIDKLQDLQVPENQGFMDTRSMVDPGGGMSSNNSITAVQALLALKTERSGVGCKTFLSSAAKACSSGECCISIFRLQGML